MRHLEPLRADVTLTYDGVDTSELDRLECRDWWLHVIDTAPLEMLHLTDLRGEATLTLNQTAGRAELTMPERYPLRRVGALKLAGWQGEVRVTSFHSQLALLQLNPYSRAGVMRPVCVQVDPWHWHLYPGTSSQLETLMAVDENDYTVDERVFGELHPAVDARQPR